MAEGGFDNEDPWLDDKLDHDGDDDDDDEEEVDTTRPFQTGTDSTPYHNGEHIKMHTFPSEHIGMDDTTPFLTQTQREWAWNTLKDLYPETSSIDLEVFLADIRSAKKLRKSKNRYAAKRGKICKKNIVFGRRVEVEFERVNAGFKLFLTKERMLNYK